MSALLPQGVALAADLLALSWPFGTDDVHKAFRKVAFEAHPDHGGSERAFRGITGAKDILLKYLEGEWKEPPPRKPPPPPPKPKPQTYRWTPPMPRLDWFTSLKGNLCAKCFQCHELITVFPCDNGYKWVHADEFSTVKFPTQKKAQRAARGWLEYCQERRFCRPR